MIAGIRRAPVGEHALESALGDIRLRQTFRYVGETQSRKRGAEHLQRRVEGELAADWFTGTVRIDPLFQAPAPARVIGASVTFEPGANAAWHSHPIGQTLMAMTHIAIAEAQNGKVVDWMEKVSDVQYRT